MLSKIMKEFDAEFNDKKLRSQDLANIAIGLEDGDATIAMESFDTLGNTVDDVLTLAAGDVPSFEDFQKNAATKAAAMAIDPSGAMSRSTTMPQVKGHVVSVEDMGVEDAVNTETLSMEAFDGQAINSAVRYSFAYNLLASKQDGFGEMLFPTVVLDPASAGANVVVRVDNLTEQILRSNATSDKAKMKKTSIIKAMSKSSSPLSDERNRLIPVSKAATAAVLDQTQEYVETITGENITTAPIKFGITVPLIGISQTDAMLAKGVANETDALDRRVVVEDVFYTLTDGTNTSKHSFDVSAFPFNNFTHTTQDHEKDMALSFSTSSFVINTALTKQVDGSDSAVLDALAVNHDIVVKLVLHGSGNAADGDVIVYATAFELVEVRDAGGNVLPTTDSAYIAIKDVIEASGLTGYTLEAYTTNSNLRNMGQLVTVDTYNQVYIVPVRSGITIQKPITNQFDIENDANYLKSQIMVTGIRTSLAAVKTVVDFADTLRNATANGADVTKLELAGSGRHLVNPYYETQNIDLTSIVDSVKSSERTEDIRTALVNTIRDAVLVAKNTSNYARAFKVANAGVDKNITVAIATDDQIANYLTSNGNTTVDIGKGFDVKVESTDNDLMTGKLFVTFIVDDGKRNEQPNPLNFGQMFWSPEVSAEVTKQVNGATIRALTTNPRFLHVVNLPVLVEFNVSGISAVLGKVTSNVHDA